MLAPVTPKTAINQLKRYLILETLPLNSILYSQGGSKNPNTPPHRDPAMLRKSIKFGITKATPVTVKMIKVLTTTDFNFK